MLAASLLLNNDLCTSLDTGAVADVEINEGLSSAANNKEPDVANQSGSAGTPQQHLALPILFNTLGRW